MTENKQKWTAAVGDAKKKPWVANETTGKWFPSVVSSYELDQLVAEKSMAVDLARRIPHAEVPLAPRVGEHVLHQEYFG